MNVLFKRMRFHIFPAQNGDSILIDYNNHSHILVDGGYADTFDSYLSPMFSSLREAGDHLNLLVCTHIDADHISGLIELIEEELKSQVIPIDNIWYNAYRHIQSPVLVSAEKEDFIKHSILKRSAPQEARPISAKQGSTLAAMIGQLGTAWNTPFDGPVTRNFGVNIHGALIHILTPTEDNLNSLCHLWRRELVKHGLLSKEHSFEFWDDAFEYSLSKDLPGFSSNVHKISGTENLEEIKSHPYQADRSITNGSSISFVMELEGKRILMTGDAHAEDILAGLEKLYGLQSTPYQFDVIKLSHHGSYNNNSPALLSKIDSNNWIISTNGDVYNHPDIGTLAWIVTKDKTRCRRLLFNYHLPVCDFLNKEESHTQYTFEIIFPHEDRPLVVGL